MEDCRLHPGLAGPCLDGTPGRSGPCILFASSLPPVSTWNPVTFWTAGGLPHRQSPVAGLAREKGVPALPPTRLRSMPLPNFFASFAATLPAARPAASSATAVAAAGLALGARAGLLVPFVAVPGAAQPASPRDPAWCSAGRNARDQNGLITSDGYRTPERSEVLT